MLTELKLRFAFRIYYLCDTSQQEWRRICEKSSWDLLSEFIIFVIHRNDVENCNRVFTVEICFQNLLSLWYIATEARSKQVGLWLRFAFRIYYLCDTSQLKIVSSLKEVGWDLLSEFIIFVIHRNKLCFKVFNFSVEICFQNLLSLWYIATFEHSICHRYLLRFAFRIYYLCDTSQRNIFSQKGCRSWDLLSEFIIFVIHRNLNAN